MRTEEPRQLSFIHLCQKTYYFVLVARTLCPHREYASYSQCHGVAMRFGYCSLGSNDFTCIQFQSDFNSISALSAPAGFSEIITDGGWGKWKQASGTIDHYRLWIAC